MSTPKKFDRRSTSSQTQKRNVKLQWRADFWDFFQENREDVDFIINSNIYAACMSPETAFAFYSHDGISPEDLYSDILVKLHDSDFLSSFEERRLEREEAEREGIPSDELPAFSELNSYLTTKVRGYVRHALHKVDKPYRHFGPDRETKATRVFTSDINATDNMTVLPSNHNTDERTILNELVNRVTRRRNSQYREFLVKKLQDYTLEEIAEQYGVTAAFVGRVVNDMKDHARRLFNKPPRKVARRKKRKKLV